MSSTPVERRSSERSRSRAASLWTLVRWGLALVALGFLVRYVVVHAGELRGSGLTLRPLPLLASVPVLFAYYAGRALTWHVITVVAGAAVRVPRAVVAWNYSLLGKYIPGKVFLLLARVHFYREDGAPTARVTFAFFLETVATLSASLLTILLALLFADIGFVAERRGWLVLVLFALAAGLHPRLLGPLLNVALRLLRRPPVDLGIPYHRMLACVGLATVNWLVFGFGFYLFIQSVYRVPAVTIVYLAGAISLASLAGIFAVLAPSGLGVREGVLALLLTELMAGPLAAAIALASRLWVTVGEALLIGLTFLVANARLPRLSSLRAATQATPVAPLSEAEPRADVSDPP